MGVGTSTLISLLSFGVASVVALSQLIKWVQEFKDRRRLMREAATKADAERDSIAIKGAEGVLLMMQSTLDVAKQTENELRVELREARKLIRELENENGTLNMRINTLELARQRRNSGRLRPGGTSEAG